MASPVIPPPTIFPSQIQGLPADSFLPTYIQQNVPGYSAANPLAIGAPPSTLSSIGAFFSGLFGSPSSVPASTVAGATTPATSPGQTSWWQQQSGIGAITNQQMIEYAALGLGAVLLIGKLKGRKR